MNNNSIDVDRIKKKKDKPTITPRMILLIILCTIIAGGLSFIIWKFVKKHILTDTASGAVVDTKVI